MLRRSRYFGAAVDWNRSQVLGAEVPSYARFPFRGSDILRLYRNFWGLIARLPPGDQKDAAFKLRNEFRSKRFIVGEKRIGKEFHRAKQKYEYYKSMLDDRDVKAQGLLRSQREVLKRPGEARKVITRLTSTDAAWQTLRMRANGTIPNLRNVPESKQVPVQCDSWHPYESQPIPGNRHSSHY